MKNKTLSAVILIFLLISLPGYSFALDNEKILTDLLWSRVIALRPPHRPKVALVLGGGGARGFAHIGVLKVLEEEKVPIDIVTGTSVGALIGALYASGLDVNQFEKMSENVGWNDLVNASGPALVNLLLTNQLLSSERMEKYLKKNIRDLRFDELKIKFACVATDIITGERIIFKEGEIVPCVRASATMPGVFEPVEYRHRYLVDGGLVDNIPVDVAKLLGADFIIAVAVSGNFSKNRISNVFMVLTQSINIQGKLLDKDNLGMSDIVIQPDVGDVSAIDLGCSNECIDAGITATRKSVAVLKQMLIKKTSAYYLFR
ncbi:MAG: patatin-like phospholipase family protein [Elusimicrobia bacterium]|nr:patatin-like phospholipase family protein [Candidatus Liberimonas magnetica]